MIKAFLLTVIWVMPGSAEYPPEIVKYDIQAASIEECYKDGIKRSKDMFEKHDGTGSVRYICFDKENVP